MKTKFLTFIGIFFLLIVGCNNDDDIKLEEMIFDPDVSANKTEVNVPITFTDYSTGVASRLWTFPGGNPATSTEEEVDVTFAVAGPITCKVEVTFMDGFTETKDMVIQVGNELYARGIFGFEDTTTATEAWKYWVSDGSNALTFTIDKTQGANGTSSCAKIEVTKPGVEIQLYTKGNSKPYNAILRSNTAYTFSFWIKSPTLTSLMAAEVSNQSDAQKVFKNYAWWSPVPAITGSWEQKFIEIPAQDIAATYSEGQANNVYTQFKFMPPTAGTYYIDEVSIKENK
jgi:hypothetical protein